MHPPIWSATTREFPQGSEVDMEYDAAAAHALVEAMTSVEADLLKMGDTGQAIAKAIQHVRDTADELMRMRGYDA